MKLSDVAEKVRGLLIGKDAKISNFCSNSKECSKGSLFFALKGTKMDGHAFLNEVYTKGGFAITQRDITFLPYVKVEDPRTAMMELAFDKVKGSFRIAVTGSCGKTTTKEIIAHLLGRKNPVCKSAGNLNTDVGISLSILNSSVKPKYAVLEMGARFPGDIKKLARAFKPDISIITCIGSSHSKYMDPLFEKLSIADYTKKFVIYDGTDKRVESALKGNGVKKRKYVSSFKYQGSKTIVNVNGNFYTLNGIWGEGQISDLEFALTLMDELNLEWDLRSLENFNFLNGRMNVIRVGKNMVIDDTYNSNFESLSNLVKSAFNWKKNNIIWILAPMEEIKEENELKERLMELKNSFSPKAIFTLGRDFYPFGQKYRVDELLKVLKDGDVIVVKGSRMYQLEKVVEEIRRSL